MLQWSTTLAIFFSVRVCLQINLIYAANMAPCATFPHSHIFSSMAHTVSAHTMDDGVVIEYLFRIIHHRDVLLRCGDGGGCQYHDFVILFFDLSILFYFILFYFRWTIQRREKKSERYSRLRIFHLLLNFYLFFSSRRSQALILCFCLASREKEALIKFVVGAEHRNLMLNSFN